MRAALFLAALLVSTAAPARAASGPSFDCRKATTVVEKQICAAPELAAADRHLAAVFRAYQPHMLTSEQKAQVHADQAAWLKERDACGSDRTCLEGSSRRRADRLEGRSPELPLAGNYEAAKIGSLTLFPLGARYLATLQTAQPDDGRWTCEFEGFATPEGGNQLRFESADGQTRFDAQVRRREAILVADTPQAAKASADLCGAGGSIQFDYRRAPAN